MPKLEAHQKAVLHRAFLFYPQCKRRTMLQQRAKHISPLGFGQTLAVVISDRETNIQAGMRRLQEEMGFTTDLNEIISFIYKAPFDNGLTEHEFDHVLIGL